MSEREPGKDSASRLRELSGEFPVRVPSSTYRLQMNSTFTFDDASRIIPYLRELGITDIYCSPYLKARRGSTHGYDITDYCEVNPELGGEEAFLRFARALRDNAMGLIMDIVPNHMCISGHDNLWWMDVLENGRGSPYARYFDIDWQPVKEELENKVLIPVLGDQYGRVLDRGELGLHYEAGRFYVTYYEHRLPVDTSTESQVLAYGLAGLDETSPDTMELMSILTAIGNLPSRLEIEPAKVAERRRESAIIQKRLDALFVSSVDIRKHIKRNIELFNERSDEGLDLLDRLLSSQVYRLAYWQVATEEINYRRFFDINDLGALRTEEPAVFEDIHSTVLRHVGEGHITGLRVDHPDGLHNPKAYFAKLQRECLQSLLAGGSKDSETLEAARVACESAAAAVGGNELAEPFYIIGEKILMPGEKMPTEWPVYGTTGYVFMNYAGGIFVDSGAKEPITRIYDRFTRTREPFAPMAYEKKKLIMQSYMASEINMLAHALNRISERDRRFRDFTLNSLVDAIVETIANFPVYRTYIEPGHIDERDRRYVEHAIGRAARKARHLSGSVFEFLRDVLLLQPPDGYDEHAQQSWVDFTMRFQQLTGPVMAKGIEDTVFYNFNRLVSLNDVGGEPENFGTPVAAFHGQNIERRKRWPYTVISTSTHDSKRSEDARVRISSLTEMHEAWGAALTMWSRLNKRFKTEAQGAILPDRNTEYAFYMNLIGVWPHGMQRPDEQLQDRMSAYMIKAAREAKAMTTWINRNPEYEDALTAFVHGALGSIRFLKSFIAIQNRTAWYGALYSLSQALLKITSPGVPDFYQGSELMHLRLVDPDNRAAVDYAHAEETFRKLKASEGATDFFERLLADPGDGRAKLYLTYKALNFRNENRELFLDGQYTPLDLSGAHARSAVAFLRTHPAGGRSCIVIAPRMLMGVATPGSIPLGEHWQDTRILLPEGFAASGLRDVFTSERAAADDGSIKLADALTRFPAALMALE